MDGKDPKPLTIGDILDQLVKPSVTQAPEKPQPAPISPTKPQPLSQNKVADDFKLPPIVSSRPPVSSESPNPGKTVVPSELKLSIRTMNEDLARLKKGQAPLAVDLKKEIKNMPTAASGPIPPPPPPANISSLPSALPPLSPKIEISPPPLSKPSLDSPLPGKNQLPAHIHEEMQIADKDNVPFFLGAPIPKKKAKPEEEKVEYSVIAKVIGSGMTTGIISTIIVAIIGYGLVYYYFLRPAEDTSPTPTPIATEIPDTVRNELKIIFNSFSEAVFSIPSENIISAFKTFAVAESLAVQDFKRISFKNWDDSKAPSFIELMDKLSMRYPQEIRNWIKDDSVVLLYGQAEDPNNKDQAVKRLVFIVEITNKSEVENIIKNWESTIANDLKDIFGIDPAREATASFLDNQRQGVNIRYKNFPFPDKSIDYAIVPSLSGRHYLVLTNSRESMFSPIDKIRGL